MAKPRDTVRDFNFSPADFINDRYVVTMTFAQIGMYITLLCRAWDMEEPGVIPGGDEAARRLAGAGEAEWAEALPALRKCFQTTGGQWVQKRLRSEALAQLRRIRDARSTRRAAAKAGWRSRECFTNELPRNDNAAMDLDAPAMPPSPSQILGSRSVLLPEASPLSVEQTPGSVQTFQLPKAQAEIFHDAELAERELSISLQGLVKRIADLKAMPIQTLSRGEFDTDQVAEYLESVATGPADTKRLFQLAGWFWKTGTRDMSVVMALLKHAVEVRPSSWYAFYAPDGEARLGIETRAREQSAATEKAAHDEADRKFLGGRKKK